MPDKPMGFLPEDYVERRIEQRTNLICLTLFALVLAGVIGGYVVTSRTRAEVREQSKQVNAAYTEAARRLEQLEQLQIRKQQMLRKAKVTATLLEPVPRTFLMADLINRMPATLSLLEVRLNSKLQRPVVTVDRSKSALANKKAKKDDKKGKSEPAEPPVPQYIVSLSLEGVAPTDVQVAQYLSSLAQSDLLSDVNLVYSEESEIQKTPLRKFRVEMTLADDADVRHIEPLRVPRLKFDPMRDATPQLGRTLGTAAGPASAKVEE